MIADRRLAVLQAIVQDYVDTREPVGSKSLVQRYDFDVSAATIRNDMAVLEDLGLIQQPHTSAGRVPTDRGYRVFVDALSRVKPLSVPQRNAITQFLESATDINDVVERTVKLLAQLTHNVAVVQYPSLSYSVIRSVQLVALDNRRLIIIVVTLAGQLQQFVAECAFDIHNDDLEIVAKKINTQVAGVKIADALQLVQKIGANAEAIEEYLFIQIATAIKAVNDSEQAGHLATAGTANLGRELFASQNFASLLDALEEQVVLLRLFANLNDDVAVSIGSETGEAVLADVAIVSSSYGNVECGANLARIGVLGPKRMDYSSNMAAVRAIANYITRFVQEKS